MRPDGVSRTLAAVLTVSATLLLGCGGGGGDIAAPEVGTLEVITTTSGPEPDGDGYAISIDGASPAAVAANATFRQSGVAAGSHTVELSGIAGNCTVSGGLRLGVSVTANSVATATYAVICSPTTGTIQVTTIAGTPADPDGYQLVLDGVETQTIATGATVTIPGVSPGAHTLGLGGVAEGCLVDGDNPLTVTVTAGQTAAATIAVTCAPPPPESGTLAVTTQTTGPEQDPDGYTYSVDAGEAHAIGANATVNVVSLAAGSHALTLAGASANCAIGGDNPRSVTVLAGGTVQVAFRVTCTATTGPSLNLRIDGWQLTQSVQSPAGDVPLVNDRDGYLRVFVLANEANTVAPSVRVRLYRNGTLTSTLTVPGPGASAPRRREEERLASSWNVKIPRELIGPGLAVLADVDPGNTIPEANETDNSFPVSGRPRAQNVRDASILSIRFVPVKQRANGLQGNVSTANRATFLDLVRRMYPLPGTDGDAHAVYTTTTSDALEPDDANGAWVTILSELDALRIVEGTARTYYGVVRIGYSSGIAGLGYLGTPTAMGYDVESDKTRVTAHELGHTWNRQHSPCGNPGTSEDPAYPYPGGLIGVYGMDMLDEVLKDPSVPDIMGYCGNPWISDYTYKGVMAYRASSGSVAAAREQRCLLVWGRIVNGRPVLEPAFEVMTRPSLPKRGGPYSLDGLTAGGARVFSLSFDAAVVADDPHGSRHFAFAVPLGGDAAARLGSIRLQGPGGAAAGTRTEPPLGAARTPDIVEARPVAGGAALHWDAQTHPMLMVRDPDTGEVLSFARGGDVEVSTDKAALDVVVSDRVGSRQTRVRVDEPR